MATKITSDQRRTLAMLADAGLRGVPEAMLVDVHGFTVDALAGLVRAGYARVAPESVRAAGRTSTVVRMRIRKARAK